MLTYRAQVGIEPSAADLLLLMFFVVGVLGVIWGGAGRLDLKLLPLPELPKLLRPPVFIAGLALALIPVVMVWPKIFPSIEAKPAPSELPTSSAIPPPSQTASIPPTLTPPSTQISTPPIQPPPPPPSTTAQYLKDIVWTMSAGASKGPCRINGTLYERSIILTTPPSGPAKVEIKSPPGELDRLSATVGLADDSPTSENVTFFIQSGGSPVGGQADKPWPDEEIESDSVINKTITIHAGQLLRIQASSSGVWRLCIGDIQLHR